MSETPRTDAARSEYQRWCEYAKDYGHFPEAMEQAPDEADPFWIADKLERESAELHQQVCVLQRDFEDMVDRAELAEDKLDVSQRENADLRTKLETLTRENDTLRGLLGNSAKDCTYCGLPAADQAKCAHGFPGCSRADDQMLSKHFADGHAAECLRKELEEAERKLAETQSDFAELILKHKDLEMATAEKLATAARVPALVKRIDQLAVSLADANVRLAEAEQRGADAARREAAGICKGISAAPSSLWEEPGCWSHAADNCASEILASIGQKVEGV